MILLVHTFSFHAPLPSCRACGYFSSAHWKDEKDKDFELAVRLGDLSWFFIWTLSGQEFKHYPSFIGRICRFLRETASDLQPANFTDVGNALVIDLVIPSVLPHISSLSQLGRSGEHVFSLEGRILWCDPLKMIQIWLSSKESTGPQGEETHLCLTNRQFRCSCSPLSLFNRPTWQGQPALHFAFSRRQTQAPPSLHSSPTPDT